jgi:hypothetical protein
MNQRRSRSDDVLFLSAFSAILIGVLLLLYTTKAFDGLSRAWPLLVVAAGGFLLYISLVRSASFYVLFGGVFFVLEGSFLQISVIAGWKMSKAWPLGMAVVGLSVLASSLLAKKRLRTSFLVPSLGFILLGLVFALFSFGYASINFKGFVAMWWPCLLIVGGISLFVAYGLTRRARSMEGRKRSDALSASAGRPGHRRGPYSGS